MKILLLQKTRENIAATTQNIIKIIFEIHFSFLLIIFRNDIERFVYFLLIDDDEIITRLEIMKIVYKINLNKTLKINKIINKALRQLAQIIIKEIYFFSTNTLKKTFNYYILRKALS